MIKTILPYVPSIDRIFDTMDSLIGQTANSIDYKDDYVSFLINWNILKDRNGTFVLNKKIFTESNDFNFKLSEFQIFIFQSIPIIPDLFRFIENKNPLINDLNLQFNERYSEQDIRVALSWLEKLNLIKFKQNIISIVLEEQEYDDYINLESIYPIDYNSEINVKEEHFSIFEYSRKIKKGDIILNPEFQRNLVWKTQQKSQFIESTILGIPIPPIYLKRNSEGQLIIVDGLQRTSAIMSYLNNEFKLQGLEALVKLNGKFFNDLQTENSSLNIPARIEDKQLLFYILDYSIPMPVVYDIFNRINTGGTKLERQEIRNCIFIGKSTDLLYSLSRNVTFIKAIDNGISKKRMKDLEAILRCLSFILQDYRTEYKSSMDEFLENTMKKLNKLTVVEIEDLEQKFLAVIEWIYSICHEKTFRIPSETSKGRINIAVMETLFYCMYKQLKVRNKISDKELYSRINKLLKDSNYLNAVRISTGNSTKVKIRFELAQEYLIFKF